MIPQQDVSSTIAQHRADNDSIQIILWQSTINAATPRASKHYKALSDNLNDNCQRVVAIAILLIHGGCWPTMVFALLLGRCWPISRSHQSAGAFFVHKDIKDVFPARAIPVLRAFFLTAAVKMLTCKAPKIGDTTVLLHVVVL